MLNCASLSGGYYPSFVIYANRSDAENWIPADFSPSLQFNER